MTRVDPRRVRVRGYALPLVLIFLAVLAVSCVAALVALELAARSTGAVIGRRQAFYECDNATRVASSVAREYLRTTALPTDADLKLAVCGALVTCPNAPSYVDGAFSVDSMTVALSATQLIGAIPNGPFQGTVARQNDVALDVELTKDATGDRCHVRQDSTVAEVKLTSFFVLVDGYADFHPEGPLDIEGAVHANGDACLLPRGVGSLRVDRVTTAGRLKAQACPRAAPPAGGGTSAIEDQGGAPQLIDGTMDNGCINCVASSMDWRAFALLRWGGHAQDTDHAVPALRIPAAAGVAVPNGPTSSNAQTQRFLVDPARAADAAGVQAARLAWLADIRILNGVWYKKDAINPTSWPGIPIWSDHPVAFASANEGGIEGAQNVGQGNLFAGAKPSRYSYYAYDAGAQTFTAINWAAAPVLSYGTLKMDGGRLRPGVHLELCPAPGIGTAAISTPTCRPEAESLALGARSGFRDPRVAAADGARSRILPINFDVEALAAALADMNPNELGAEVPAFNGIVWIGVSWNGAHNTGGAPSLWPDVTTPNDGTAFDVSGGGGVAANALPYPLCGASGNPLVLGTQIPACVNTTRPNAVRVINAGDLSAFAGTGLTIASNGPVYLQGSFGAVGGAGVANPVRAMLAGDAVTVLSPGFDDGAHSWAIGATVTAATGDARIAGAVLTGDVEATGGVPGAGIENATRFIEDWSGRTFTLQGALTVGFRSVFQRQPASAGAFVAPARVWRHDPLFAGTVIPLPPSPDQWAPPGTASMFVQAVKNWQRD